MIFLRIWLFSLLSAVLTEFALAQPVIGHYTVEDGLPSLEVYFSYRDHMGNIWFCSDRGLSRFNGYEFENFSSDDNLSYNTLFKAFEDGDNNLWFTCFNGTLCKWDHKTDTFVSFEHNTKLRELLGSSNWVHAMGFSQDTIVMTSYNRSEIIRYTKGNKNLSVIADKPEKHFSGGLKKPDWDNVIRIPIDKDRLKPDFTFTSFDYSIPEQKLDAIKQTLKSIKQEVLVNEVYWYDGYMMYCTRQGLRVYQNDSLIYHVVPRSEVSSVTRDMEGNFWLTTTDRGVFVVRFDKIDKIDITNRLSYDEKMTSIAAIGDRIIVGTSQGNVFEPGSFFYQNFSADGSDIHRLYTLNGAIYASYGNKISLSDSAFIVTCVPDPGKSYLWIPLRDHKYFYSQASSYGVMEHRRVIWQKEGRIMDARPYGTQGLIYSSMDSLFLTDYINGDDRKSLSTQLGLQNTFIRRIYLNGDSLIVFATFGSGVIVVHNSKVLAKIGKSEGLISNMVNNCYMDTLYKRIWCTTNKGVSIIDYSWNQADGFRIKSISNLSKRHGLASNYIIDITGSGEYIWIAGSRSINKIPRNFQLPKARAPSVAVNGLKSNGFKRDPDEPFKFNENNIEIFFSAFSIQRPVDGPFYRYRLRTKEKTDTLWFYTNDRRALFIDLNHGEYTFEVCARSENSEWSNPTTMAFTINPFILDRLSIRILLAGILISLITILVRSRFLKLKDKNQQELNLNRLNLKLNELELASLRSQMNPHFIFNTLMSIQKRILSDEKWEADDLLTRFAKLIRTSLNYSRTNFIPLEDEIKFISNYLDIEKARFHNKFNYRIEVDTELNKEELKIPPLLIQPICENSIKHGIGTVNGEIVILFKKIMNNTILVVIEDNGSGYYKVKSGTEMNKSLGLEIIRSRLKLFKSKGYDTSIEIEPVDPVTHTGTRVVLKIPVQ